MSINSKQVAKDRMKKKLTFTILSEAHTKIISF